MLTRNQRKKQKRECSETTKPSKAEVKQKPELIEKEKPKKKIKKTDQAPILKPCIEFKKNETYPKYKRNLRAEDRAKSEQMYAHIKDYLLEFPLSDALVQTDVNGVKYEEEFKADPLALFRNYTPVTIATGAWTIFDHVGETVKTPGKPLVAVGYGMQVYKAYNRQKWPKPYILVYHGIFDKEGTFIQGQRLSKFQNGQFNLQEGYFVKKKWLVKGSEYTAHIHEYDEDGEPLDRNFIEPGQFQDVQPFSVNYCGPVKIPHCYEFEETKQTQKFFKEDEIIDFEVDNHFSITTQTQTTQISSTISATNEFDLLVHMQQNLQ